MVSSFTWTKKCPLFSFFAGIDCIKGPVINLSLTSIASRTPYITVISFNKKGNMVAKRGFLTIYYWESS